MTKPEKVYRVTVWHGNIKPENRDSTTLSDGAIFRSWESVVKFSNDVKRKGGYVFNIKTIENPSFWYESFEEYSRVGLMSLAELEVIKKRGL